MHTIKIRDVMTADVVTAREDTPFKELARLMRDRGVSGIPIVDDEGKMIGLVTEADLLKGVGHEEEERRRSLVELILRRQPTDDIDDDEMTAGDIMSEVVVDVAPDTPVDEAIRILIDVGIKRLPVTENDRLVGIVSRPDLLKPFLRPDAQIKASLEQDLILGTLWIDPSTVDVQVEDGVVTLKGRVDFRSTKHILAQTARTVPGVIAVHDEVEFDEDDRDVQAGPPRSPLRGALE